MNHLTRFPVDEGMVGIAFIIDAVISRKEQELISAVTYLLRQFEYKVHTKDIEGQSRLKYLKMIRCDEKIKCLTHAT